MKRASSSAVVLASTLVSFAVAYPTEIAAGDRSNRGASVSAGGVSVSAGRGGASVSTGRGGASVSANAGGASVADRGGASVSAGRDGASVADRGGASVSAGRDGASVADRGGTSVSAGRGGASVSGGGASVSADRGGASVSSSGGTSVSVDRDRASASADPGDKGISGGRTGALPADRPSADRSYKSYGSIGEWFDDLRTSWFGGGSERSDEAATARASATQKTERSQAGGTQVNRVVQEKSATATATDGGSAVAEASNVNVTEQRH